MLQSIHDKIQGFIAGIIAIIIALTFALWGVQNYLHSGPASVVATVNGKKITSERLQLAYEQAKRTEMLRFGSSFSFDQQRQAELKKNILQQLIKQEVLLQAATKMGLGVSNKQLWSIISNMPIFQVNGRFSPSNFQHLMQRVFYSSEQAFFKEIESLVLQQQLEKGIVESAFILPNEIEFIKQISHQQRDFGYFVLALERFIPQVQISDEAINNYYEQHQAEFLLPEKLSIQYLELAAADLQQQVKPTSEQLQQYYHTHLSSFSTPKKWQIAKFLLPLPPKADAAALTQAKNKILGVASKLNSPKDVTNIKDEQVQVTVTWVGRNEVAADFAAQLDKLELGQLSPMLNAKDGLNMIKVLATQEPQVVPYVTVAAKVKASYERQQLTQAFTEASEKLADLIYTNSDSLEPAAKELGLSLKETSWFTRTSKNEGILANNKIVKAAFSDTVLKQRYNSNLIEIGPSKLVVLRLKDHIPEKLQPLTEVRPKIVEILKQQEAQKMAANLANELLQAVLKGKTIEELSKHYGLVWHKMSGVTYNKNGPTAKLTEAAFNLAKPTAKNVAAVVVALDNSYAVLRLDRVAIGIATNDDNANSNNLIKLMPHILGQYDYHMLLNSLMDQAKIKLIEQAKG